MFSFLFSSFVLYHFIVRFSSKRMRFFVTFPQKILSEIAASRKVLFLNNQLRVRKPRFSESAPLFADTSAYRKGEGGAHKKRRALKNNGVHFAGVSSPRNARTKYLLAQGKPRFSAAHPYLPIPRLTEGVKTARIKQSLEKGKTALLPFSLNLPKGFREESEAARL